ncbi:MAG: DUF4105 domain-containing protein [Acidobacteriaceae bacterium]|nr:DUF4105 domain-containing protein [Acidobacteriaceae bacterium]MBV9039225.1 DUF4105 domain-containing protein [Acidobacteriaceae bacterium]
MSYQVSITDHSRSRFQASAVRLLIIGVGYISGVLATVWAAAALYFDARPPFPGVLTAAAFLILIVGTLVITRASRKGLFIWAGSIAAVLVWWFSLSPSNNRNWQPDVAKLPWGEVRGDQVTLHNIRNCDYVTETDYTPHWESMTVDVSQIKGVDLFLIHWGSPWIAHAIVSFEITNGKYLALSIKARKTVGQTYSAIRGFFRQYNLIYLLAEERDVIRVRTTFRKGEDVYLYRTKTTPADSQQLFLAYVKWMNAIKSKPEWYNALTSNCTSGVVSYLAQAKVGGISKWDWRTLLNGRGDEMLYELGDLQIGDLPFTELKKQAFINPVARKADDAPDFSQRIRAGRLGFSQAGTPIPEAR